MKRTPLYNNHIALGAKMVPFGGWDMPLQYEGILKEYENTRSRVSLFDTSHMGEFLIHGSEEACGLERIVSQPLADMPVKSCRYGVLVNEKGGVIDDQIVFRSGPEKWFIVVNGATTEKDAVHFRKYLKDPDCFEDISAETGKIDVQGPGARRILISLVEGIQKLDYYTFDEFSVLGEKVIVSRTGYTGELGYEIYFPWDKTSLLWDELLGRGAAPAGLGVRDVLRIEMGYSLYGHELDDDISPLDAGLNRFIGWDKEFIGKAALLKQKERGIRKTVACFVSETRRSPRADQKIFNEDKKEIGIVTSGTFSPHLQRGVGLGFVEKESVKTGDLILIGETGPLEARVVKRPIYDKGTLKD